MTDCLPQAFSQCNHHGKQRAYVKHYVEKEISFDAKQFLRQNEMSAAGNGQKFREPLQQSQKYTLQNSHIFSFLIYILQII